jgi:hypothetical protein
LIDFWEIGFLAKSRNAVVTIGRSMEGVIEVFKAELVDDCPRYLIPKVLSAYRTTLQDPSVKDRLAEFEKLNEEWAFAFQSFCGGADTLQELQKMKMSVLNAEAKLKKHFSLIFKRGYYKHDL